MTTPHHFKCNHCGCFAAISERKLLEHVNLRHEDLRKKELKSHMCDFCGYSTSNKSFFEKHVNTHTQETLYSCEKCPFTSHSYRDPIQ